MQCVIQYQVDRETLLRIWWRQMLFRPGFWRSVGLLILAGLLFGFSMPNQAHWIVLFIATLLILFPIRLRSRIARTIDDNSTLTDPKTLEFDANRLMVAGPNWKSEFPWTNFHGFSEDENYFHLALMRSKQFTSVIPKAAFSPEQQELFRQYARAHFPGTK